MQACSFGEWDDCDQANYSFFDPKIINQPRVTSFFVTCHSLYYNNSNYLVLQKTNADEWAIYLDNKLDGNDIMNIFGLYGLNADSVFNFYSGVSTVAPKLDWANKLTGKIIALNNKQAINYFIFSKKIEKIMTWNYMWDYEHKGLDTALYVTSIGEAKSEITKSKSSFLKVRYAFQVQRILFYLNRYDECAKWYNEDLKPWKPEGSMAFRSLGFYAGCLYHQKKYAESNYLFSLIYDQYPVLNEMAFTSFHPWEDADWNATLQMAKSSHEKEVLWQLFGVYADPLKGMKEIYVLNPKSEMIDLLLTRAVNIYEKKELTNPDYMNEYGGEENPQDQTDTASWRRVFDSSNSFAAFDKNEAKDELSTFIKSVADKKNTHDPCLWLNAYSYLNWMNKKYEVAENYLAQLKSCNAISDLNKSQMAITDALIKFGKIDQLNVQTEQHLYELFSEMNKNPNEKSEAVYQYISKTLSKRYLDKGDTLMSELSCNCGSGFYKEEENSDKMLDFMRRKNHTSYEAFLLNRYSVKPYNIIEYKAINELKAFHLDKAIKWFEQDRQSGSAELFGNPFTIHIVDCHDCDHNAPQKTKYTKYTFALKMKELLQKAKTIKDKNEKAQNYFLFANGLYNMTYDGNGRMITDYSYLLLANRDYYETTDGDEDVIDSGACDEAMKYYHKALDLSTKKEFKAKCAWMCAKCELNNWYQGSEETEDANANQIYVEGYYFKMMKAKFSDTKYYQEVIAECGYFCSYTGGGSECIRNKE